MKLDKYISYNYPQLMFFALFLTLFKRIKCSISLTYPSAFVLPNNNFFVIEKNGIFCV